MNRQLSNSGRIVTCLYFVAFGIGFVYIFYDASTGTGLVGNLMKRQFDVFGAASLKGAVIAAFAVLSLPLIAISVSLRIFAPSLMFRPTESRTPASPSGPVLGGYSGWLTRLSWTTVFAYAAIPLIVTAAAYEATVYLTQEEQQGKVHEIDLTSDPGAPPSDLPAEAKFAGITGLIVRRYASVYTRGTVPSAPDKYEVFAPLTGREWKPADPVRYFVHIKASRSVHGEPQWPEAFRQGGPAKFSGQVGRALPAFVERDYQSKGLKIAPAYFVVDWRDMPNHQIPASGAPDIVLGVGLLLSGSALISLVMVKVNKKEILERRRRAGFD